MPKSATTDREFPVPQWLQQFEQTIGNHIPLHPNTVSTIKLFAVIPFLLLVLFNLSHSPYFPVISILLFLLFGLFDYLDGVLARTKNLETKFGRLYDRLTDYPLLFALAWLCLDILPVELLLTKIALDVVIFILYLMKQGSTENRLRTVINYATLLVLLLLTLGVAAKFITVEMAEALLLISIFFNAVVILRNIGLLQKRFIADALSAGNLLCGFASMYMAYHARLDLSLVFLMLGAGFDGMDGAAARKFGSTRWGMFSDDIADGVNYGIAPGVAIYFQFRVLDQGQADWLGNFSLEGLVLGSLFIVFTISRLIFFTLAKSGSDPNYFRGAPSTVGGIIVLSSAFLFREYPAILGLMIGFACVIMVSFDSQYRHLGRAIPQYLRYINYSPILVVILLITGVFVDKAVPIAVLLALTLMYGFFPVVSNFKSLFKSSG
jgi:phosphatidylserine synthase